ncbi:hypothetical protein [Streptomyces sp. NPDC051776]|uniref:hypothetical protein n=1 Tax=Streptomyces sp. NPDC051776 TaxID=3155414 RepID=UPI003431352E
MPARRPFGMVRLPCPVASVQAARAESRITAGEFGQWYGPRVALPPLSIEALRMHPSRR